MTTSESNQMQDLHSPDGVVTLHCPREWLSINPVSDGVCLALAAPAGLLLVELLCADASEASRSQASDLQTFLQIASVTIERLGKEHADLRIIRQPTSLPQWPEKRGTCATYTVEYAEANSCAIELRCEPTRGTGRAEVRERRAAPRQESSRCLYQ